MKEYQRVTVKFSFSRDEMEKWYEGSDLEEYNDKNNVKFDSKQDELRHASQQRATKQSEEYLDQYSEEYLLEHSNPYTRKNRFIPESIIVYALGLKPQKIAQEEYVTEVISVDDDGNEEVFV